MALKNVANQEDPLAFESFISSALRDHLAAELRPVAGITGLQQLGASGGLESEESLRFLCNLYDDLAADLRRTLAQRVTDRKFVDERTRACFALNQSLGIRYEDPNYRTVIGQDDRLGRIVVGPQSSEFFHGRGRKVVAEIPEFLAGSHVTLFGPPDDAKLSINAMNAFYRRLPDEPAIVSELVDASAETAKWGADDEDSKTPLRADLIAAGVNLSGCLQGTLAFRDPSTGRDYQLAADRLSVPIKRFPGLALPCAFLFRHGKPLPLHLYDFALHIYAHWNNPAALAFYVPKLENEEEAGYIRTMVERAEQMLARMHPTYRVGTVRLMVVIENPRALFRVNEIIDELHPYFAGASLGWHDFLASAARLMKEDANFRIPVKADPNIVIRHIKGSHDLLAAVVGSRGGISVGGMYGVLPSDSRLDSPSFQIAIRGFFRDVITQLKRGLNGFWVAHPDFVRLGMALVEAWKRKEGGETGPLDQLISALLLSPYREEVMRFVQSEDVLGLDTSSPLYQRALLVADGRHETVIANNDPEEIRYNVFQSLQYLTDWLCGHGCVALPAQIDGVEVRVMDDLATAERSRWEVWAEIHHGRFAVEDLLRIAHEELHFIRTNIPRAGKSVQVKWDDRTRKWYPVAMHLMLKLMTDTQPVEFASELLLLFTVPSIRNHPQPLVAAVTCENTKYSLRKEVDRLHALFSACGSRALLAAMKGMPIANLQVVRETIMSFSKEDVAEAASFHGDIGEGAATLESQAREEQSASRGDGEEVRVQLLQFGASYQQKFGYKFLVSAHGKSGREMLAALRLRLEHSAEAELQHAREALWNIAERRLRAAPIDSVMDQVEAMCQVHGVQGLSIGVLSPHLASQTLVCGERAIGKPMTAETRLQIASLSKAVATAFAMEYFRGANIPLSSCVDQLLRECGSPFRVQSAEGGNAGWPARATLADLFSHQAFNVHYVNGIPADLPMPDCVDLLRGSSEFGYPVTAVVVSPGEQFRYSGGGFLLLQHLLEKREGQSIDLMIQPFLRSIGCDGLSFASQRAPGGTYADGATDDGATIFGGYKQFPALAAGAVARPQDIGRFLAVLGEAYRNLDGCCGISHDTAVKMLHGVDHGSLQFMGCLMGLGIFTVEAGANRLAVHQGANDGFRALMIHCYSGPNAGCGVVVLARGEDRAVECISEVVRVILQQLEVSGIDWSRVTKSSHLQSVAAEQRVNSGYRDMIFEACIPDFPEVITMHGGRDEWSEYNLAAGATIVAVSNQRFARADNLVCVEGPRFDPALFGRQGKVMDSWESVRHNPKPCDWVVICLARPERIDYFTLSTQFHLGNHAAAVSMEASCGTGDDWTPMLLHTPLRGHSLHTYSSLTAHRIVSKIRVNMFPDGGLTRLALYGESLPDALRAQLVANQVRLYPPFDATTERPLSPTYITTAQECEELLARAAQWRLNAGQHCDERRVSGLNLASAGFGARVISATNEHYGKAARVISPYPPLHMFDGLESARSRQPGHSENVIIALARPACLAALELDFTYFVNNNPLEVSVQGQSGGAWKPLVVRTTVKAYAGNSVRFAITDPSVVEQVRVTVFPDGGINRVRVYPVA